MLRGMGLRETLRLVANTQAYEPLVMPEQADIIAALDIPVMNGWNSGLLYNAITPMPAMEAMAVPAINRGLSLISGTIASLPLHQYSAIDGRKIEPAHPLLYQPDPQVPKVVTYGFTLHSLQLYNVAYWQVLSVYADTGKVREARYIDNTRVLPVLDKTNTVIVGYNVNGMPVPDTGVGSLIMFQNFDPAGGLLTRGQRTIRTAAQLEAAAMRAAEEPLPQTVLKNTGVDLPSQQVSDLLQKWKAARQQKATAYLSAGIDIEAMGFNAKDQQLVEARQYIAAECARALNLDPYWVGAATNSMTYSNVSQERESLWQNTLRPLATIVEQRLSMPDITARGTEVRFDLDDYLRTDPLSRAQVYRQYFDMGVMSAQDIRDVEDIVPSGEAPTL